MCDSTSGSKERLWRSRPQPNLSRSEIPPYTSRDLAMVSIAVGKGNTEFIPVERGVLQGDPCSPLLFNICFNPLMRTLSQNKYKHLGYMWGPNVDPYSKTWLQFADDTAIIANDVKNAQTL